MSSRPDPYLLTDIAPRRGHVPSLDGLRAVSISLVVLQHFGAGLPGMPPVPGLFGVEIFFSISGFLIARLLLAELIETGRLSLVDFYFRRLLRLSPPLVALVAAMSIFMLAIGERDLRAGACALFYVTNYCVTDVGAMYAGSGVNLEGTWSLAVEEHFYLVFPLLLVWLFPKGPRALYLAVAAICLGALSFRIAYALDGRPQNFLVWRSESAFDLILGGCLVSILSARLSGRAALRRVATTTCLGGATLVFLAGAILSTTGKLGMAIGQSGVALWVAVLIVNTLLNPDLAGLRAFLNLPALQWLGRISYSLYLWHSLIALVGNHYDLLRGYPGAVGGIAASVALASASYYWLERPILRRREQWARKFGLRVETSSAAA